MQMLLVTELIEAWQTFLNEGKGPTDKKNGRQSEPSLESS